MTETTHGAQVLIVEDEADHADVMADALRKPGHVCTIVNGVDAAYAELKGGAFDVIVTDLRMPTSAGQEGTSADGGDAGMRVLAGAAELQPEAKAIMVTAHGDAATAREALKTFGAFDFIEKPLDLQVFRSLVNRAAEQRTVRAEAGELKDLVQDGGFAGIVAGSDAMRKILRTVATVAKSTIPVLITGESGTGKELIARAVHDHSPRKDRRYVPFNCAGQSENLLEDELFGHVRGAFTGAEKDREGVFEYADKGTLFLDEIGDMPLSMQAKLLRVLESGDVVRLGANSTRNVDVRFVSATNRDLKAAVEEGTFREDLYFRINAAHVHLPPLRERRDDVPRIVKHAVARFAGDLVEGGQVPRVTDAALMRLTSFGWPGNVRQLMNVVQNMTVMAVGEAEPGEEVVLDVKHIPDEVQAGEDAEDEGSAGAGSLAGTSLEQIEKRAIRETLQLTGGNRERAAKMLGIGERTLYRKLKEYGLR
ncbi:MAG: sigma-54 dependent transcriptional regulator [Planctomycetota bacterium]